MGGLGNQLFQVSAMLYVATHLERHARCETSWFASDEARTPRAFDAERMLTRAEHYRLPPSLVRYVYGSKNPLLEVEAAPGDDVLGRLRHRWTWTYAYLQRAAYPMAVRDQLARRFERAFARLPAAAASNRAVAVHMRLGDYATDPLATRMMGLTDAGYFRDAVADVRARLGDLPIRVFTDSPELCRALYLDELPGPVELSSARDPWEALREMSSCAAVVMCNSTLSWWAAFVATEVEGRPIPVVMPEPWFAEPTAADDLLWLPEWHRSPRTFTV